MIHSESPAVRLDITALLQELAGLMQVCHDEEAPYDAQIQALEMAKADATAAITFHIESLKALLRPLVLEQRHTVKHEGLTASYVHKTTWDTKRLLQMADEIPAILQARQEVPYIMFRLAPMPQERANP